MEPKIIPTGAHTATTSENESSLVNEENEIKLATTTSENTAYGAIDKKQEVLSAENPAYSINELAVTSTENLAYGATDVAVTNSENPAYGVTTAVTVTSENTAYGASEVAVTTSENTVNTAYSNNIEFADLCTS